MDVQTIVFLVISIIPVIFCASLTRSIFISKGNNANVGIVIGILVGIFTSFVGLIITWLIHSRIVSHSKKYPLNRGGAKRLEVIWTYAFRNVTIKFDDVEIGKISSSSQKEAKQGRSFILPDNSELHVKLGNHPVNLSPAPDLTRNGKPVPDSVNDPAVELNVASNAFFGGSILSFFAGIMFLSIHPGVSFFYFLMGTLALVPGIGIRKRSKFALKFGIGLAVFFALTYLTALTSSGDDVMGYMGSASDLAEGVMFIVGLYKGKKAIAALEQEKLST